MKAYRRVEVQLHAFLTSTQYGGEWLVSYPDLHQQRNCEQFIIHYNFKIPAKTDT